jgi:hypothetical protein
MIENAVGPRWAAVVPPRVVRDRMTGHGEWERNINEISGLV